MKRIVSRANPTFKSLRALKGSARERRSRGQTLIDGSHLLRAHLQAIGEPRLVAVSTSACGHPEIAELLAALRSAEIASMPPELFDQIAPVEHASGILALIDIPEPRAAAPEGELFVLLDAVQDPGNVGTIIRSAAGAGADAVLLSPACADPWSPRALRAAMGATFGIDLRTGVGLGSFASDFDGRVVATAGRGGVPPDNVDLRGRIALMLGGEGSGLDAALAARADVTISIPLAAAVESLNVGAAAAVILFERVRQLGAKRR